MTILKGLISQFRRIGADNSDYLIFHNCGNFNIDRHVNTTIGSDIVDLSKKERLGMTFLPQCTVTGATYFAC